MIRNPSQPVPGTWDARDNLLRAMMTIRLHLARTVRREAGLRWTSYTLLRLLCRHPDASPRTLAAHLATTPTGLTDHVAELTTRNLVRHIPGPGDPESRPVQPTQAGVTLVHHLRRVLAAEEDRLLHLPDRPPLGARS